MSILTTDNRDLSEVENELRARIEAQRFAIASIREENFRLNQENHQLREVLGQGSSRPTTLIAAAV